MTQKKLEERSARSTGGEEENHVRARVGLFGSQMDPDERHEALIGKRSAAGRALPDPYTEVLRRLEGRLGRGGLSDHGSLPVPGWLRPAPPEEALGKVQTGDMVAFIDGQGCLGAAQEVRRFVSEKVLPEAPAMVAVDHSLSGGVIWALAERVGRENLSVIVLDAHTDAIPVSVTAGAVQYDAETNPRSVFHPEDPFLRERPDSYNASSFLHYLLEEAVVEAKNLYLVGVADTPPSRAAKLTDRRIRRYVDAFASLRKQGVKVLRRDEVVARPRRSFLPLRRIDTPYVYISVDLDVAAGVGVQGVRFTDRMGWDAGTLMEALGHIAAALTGRTRLIGFDISEFDPRRMADEGPGGATLRVAGEVAVRLSELVRASEASVPPDHTDRKE